MQINPEGVAYESREGVRRRDINKVGDGSVSNNFFSAKMVYFSYLVWNYTDGSMPVPAFKKMC